MENLGPFIGRGYIAEVFGYGEGRVLKLLFDEHGAEAAEREAHITSAAVEAGLPAPKIWETLTVNGRPGIVMDRIEGESMLEWGTVFPWRIYTGAKMMARMHADMHSKTSEQMPDLRDKLRNGVENAEEVSEEVRERALERLAGLPDGDAICHGDFHPDNIMMSKSGPVIIDWSDGVVGHPPADVARTVVLVESGVPLVGVIRRAVVGVARNIFLSLYLKEYFKITGMTWEEVSPWMLPVAVNYTNALTEEFLEDHLAYVQCYL